MTDKQKEVARRAKRCLEHKHWFNGVCTDLFIDELTDAYIDRIGMDEAVKRVIFDTEYWDNW